MKKRLLIVLFSIFALGLFSACAVFGDVLDGSDEGPDIIVEDGEAVIVDDEAEVEEAPVDDEAAAEEVEVEEIILSQVDFSDPMFGVWENHDDGWFGLRETTKMTDQTRLSEGYFAVDVPEGEHGDWPPHFLEMLLAASRDLVDGEFFAEIATRFQVENMGDELLVLHFQFRLDEEAMQEYEGQPYIVAAGGEGNRLGLFAGSDDGVGVIFADSQFSLGGSFCFTCLDETEIITSTGHPIYEEGDLSFFGQSSGVYDDLDEVLIIPIELPKYGSADMISFTVIIPANHRMVIWFGTAN